MVLGLVDWVLGSSGGDEVSRNQLRALVDKLVEGMLSVGARCTPYDRLYCM